MNNTSFNPQQDVLAQKESALTIITAIDHIRDTISEPVAMLTTIVNTLADYFESDLCLLSLLDRETGENTLKAINDRHTRIPQLEQLISRHLADKAVTLDTITIWPATQVLPPHEQPNFPPTLQIAAVPIALNPQQRLGAMLLARSHKPFTNQDIDLLKTAEDQIDSAIMQGYAYYDMQQRVKELETIYTIDRIRDRGLLFDEMLNVVIQQLRTAINAEVGFVMLYDLTGKQLEMRAATHDNLFKMTPYYQIVNDVANESLQQAHLICRNNIGSDRYSVMCLPLILNDQIIGVLGVVNHQQARHFTSDDRRLLTAIGSQMDTAIFESIEKRRMRQVLGRSVDPHVMERLLANSDTDFLKGERAIITVLYADIRGSTSLAEQLEPEILVEFINHYLSAMTTVILSNSGTLDKFVGDEVMALFNAPFPQPDHALKAVRVGLAMQEAHQQVMDHWQTRGIPAAPIGVGIATGELIVGEMGSTQRADYTVIGRAANLGARICGVTPANKVWISQTTYNLIANQVKVTPIPGQQFKGVATPLTVYQVDKIL